MLYKDDEVDIENDPDIIIAAAEERSDELTDWECQFVDGISNQDYAVTYNQGAVLRKIAMKLGLEC